MIRNKPLDDVNNQENQKSVPGKCEMELKVSDHNEAKRDGAVVNDAVCELKSCEDSKAKKVEGSYCGFLQISDTLAETHHVRLSGSSAPQTHNCRSQEKRIAAQYAQN